GPVVVEPGGRTHTAGLLAAALPARAGRDVRADEALREWRADPAVSVNMAHVDIGGPRPEAGEWPAHDVRAYVPPGPRWEGSGEEPGGMGSATRFDDDRAA
ncbi:hypothetical protein, partial [Marinitenerispora sediminis]|uniref:hypothetical protein n=1 Tax=Marinitenerispora sediminis TaxID=1931232 RepID=UPI000DFC0ACA